MKQAFKWISQIIVDKTKKSTDCTCTEQTICDSIDHILWSHSELAALNKARIEKRTRELMQDWQRAFFNH